jgi:hypothetical protein
MNRYILIRRLRGPAVLLLIGMLALLDESGAIHHFWGWFWPLLLILMGSLGLAERAAMAEEDMYPPAPYPGAYPYQGPNPNAPAGTGQAAAQPGTAIVPSGSNDFSGGNGGQL